MKVTTKPVTEIEACLKELGCGSLFSWRDARGAHYSPHSHPHDEWIGVIRGQITFHIDGKSYPLKPGDILTLPAKTIHAADALEDVEYWIGSR
jgi:quercetin dioxygenase-like cupin family protein